MSDMRQTTFFWTVHNFDIAPHPTGERLESPHFSADVIKNSKFSLMLYPRGAKDENYVSLYVKRHCDNAAENLFLQYELCVIDSFGNCINMQRSSTTGFRKGVLKGYSQFYERHLLLFAFKRSLLPDNRLTVRCQLLPLEDEDTHVHVDNLTDCEALSKDFAGLLESGIQSDLVIEAQGKEFRIHKAILEARCPRLISHLVKTEKSDVMVMPNVEASVLQGVLHCIYTGTCKDIGKLEEVFAVANSCEFANLKTLLFPYPDSLSAKTVVESLRLSFIWFIPSFKNFAQSNEEASYILIAEDIPKNCWMKVSLFVEESDDGKKDTILKFQKLSNYHTGAVHFKIQTPDQSDKLILLKESLSLFENGKFVIPFDIAMDSVRILANGDLELHFEIRTSTGGVQNSLQEITLSRALTHDDNRNWRSLHTDLLRFYKSRKTGDVTLNIGLEKLAAHKAVLCSRSDVFCKMFQHDSLESRTNSVTIEDVDEETMTSVLKYMYSGVTDDVMYVSKAVKLYTAADKYQLLPLKDKCREFLKLNINAENVGELLLLADAHLDEDLKKCALNFITTDASGVLSSQRGLKVLENRVDLYHEVLNVLLRFVSLQQTKENGMKKK